MLITDKPPEGILQNLSCEILSGKFLPLGKTRGIVIIMSSDVCRLWTFPCAQHNSTKSYPILMKLHRIVPWWIRKKPIEFCYDDVISDVT